MFLLVKNRSLGREGHASDEGDGVQIVEYPPPAGEAARTDGHEAPAGSSGRPFSELSEREQKELLRSSTPQE